MIFSAPVLMVVTDPAIPDLDARVFDAVQGGASVIQYRHLDAETDERVEWVMRFREVCPECPIVVNEDIAAAERGGADGVHLSSRSCHPGNVWAPSVPMARTVLGDEALVGRSIHPHNLHEPLVFEQGLDYALFGTVFASESHPGGPTAGLNGLSGAVQEARCRGRSLPVLAIGGITAENAAACIRAGAAGVAVIRSVLMAKDPAQAAATIIAAMREVL